VDIVEPLYRFQFDDNQLPDDEIHTLPMNSAITVTHRDGRL